MLCAPECRGDRRDARTCSTPNLFGGCRERFDVPGISDLRLVDLYLAYRKAKAEAYYDASHFDAIAFLDYERDLHANLRSLLKRLRDGSAFADASEVGQYSYVPKSIEPRRANLQADGMFFKCLDPFEEWHRQWSSEYRAKAKFRLVIRATIDFQVFAALWLIEAGYRYDEVLDPEASFGHRLRRQAAEDSNNPETRPINRDCVGLFEPYFYAYRTWRDRGLKTMRAALAAGKRIYAVTMDIQSFYHRASPDFLLEERFLEKFGIELTPLQYHLTRTLISAIHLWYAETPDATVRPECAIPVGLSASRVIANVLLAELDQEMVTGLSPHYYGRYVDDIFLVFESAQNLQSGVEMMRHLELQLEGRFEFEPATEVTNNQLRLILSYASREKCDLVFAGEKQKVFNLSGQHGLDLVAQIENQIRHHSSEHRLLAVLPSEEEGMATRTLLAHTDASLEPDALRKADVVSVKRLGIALLLRDMESYARDLGPKEWMEIRESFYELVDRHVLTPIGFFNFSGQLPRVMGLMIACGDCEPAKRMVAGILKVRKALELTTTAGTTEADEFKATFSELKRSLAQAAAQATTVARFSWTKNLLSLSRALDSLSPDFRLPKSTDPFKRLSKRLLHADLGRRPYRDIWLANAQKGLENPPVPSGIEIRRLLRLGAVRAFRKAAELRVPYWPGLAFSTRPISLSEITRAAPNFLKHPRELRAALFALRGSKARSHDGVVLTESEAGNQRVLQVDGVFQGTYRFALPSFLTTDEEWLDAARGTPSLTRKRYERIRRLVNALMTQTPSIDYVVFPECSVPHQWVGTIGRKLAERRISLIAGLEYRMSTKGVHNDAYLSVATDWPWHRTSVIFVQPKFSPAHEERRSLAKFKRRLAIPPPMLQSPTVIRHDGLSFAVLICSDLTNIAHRFALQGEIDVLVVVEWNRDTETFGALVEATANDLHSYVVQSNNRLYGDSRVRSPRKSNYERDLVRVRGGSQDYFVVADIDVEGLRRFQKSTPTASTGPFKPVPIGYSMSSARGGKQS